MLTRCPECSVSFRVTAEQLRLAQGAVHCGNCETVFNAITTLSKDQRENAVDQPQGGGGSVESTEDSPSGMADPDSRNPSTISAVEALPVTTETTVPSAPKTQTLAGRSKSKQRTGISAENATTSWLTGGQTDKPTSTGEEEWLRRLFDETEDDDGTPGVRRRRGNPSQEPAGRGLRSRGQTRSPTGKNTPNTARIRFRNSIPLEQGKRQPQEYRAGKTWLQHRILGNTFKTP